MAMTTKHRGRNFDKFAVWYNYLNASQMKRLYIVLIILAIAAIVGVGVGINLYNKKPADTNNLKANKKVDITKMTADFKTDSSKARKRYNNDVIEMSGTVSNIEKDQQGHVYIDFVANDVKVQCMLQDNAKADAGTVKQNDNIRLKGKYTGYSFDEIVDPQPQLQFRDCIIIKE